MSIPNLIAKVMHHPALQVLPGLMVAAITVSFSLVPLSVQSQDIKPSILKTVNFPEEDQAALAALLRKGRSHQLHKQPWSRLIQAIATEFRGAAYKDGLLDQGPQEQLVLSLSQFDCVLFIETVLAAARTLVAETPSPQVFRDAVQEQRYRQGQMRGYCSRLHYFSDWIADNQRRGLVQNLTPALGGIPFPKQLNFMSQHRHSYPKLQDNNEHWQCIQELEARLQSLTLHYIPQDKIREIETSLKPGDIVAVATAIPGLDVTHTGFIYRLPDQSTIGLIHASPGGSVQIAPDLATYIANVDQSIGIIVARPLQPPG